MSNHETVRPDPGTVLEFATAILQQTPRDLSDEVMQGWIRNKKALGKGLRTFLSPPDASAPVVKPAPLPPLEFIKTVDLPTVEAFSAKAKFQIKETDGVKVGWLGDNFKAAFVNLKKTGKNELDIQGGPLRIHKLRKQLTGTRIVEELGGEKIAETSLSHMWEMMKKQGHGQKEGDLLTNGYANIFIIRDDDDGLWAVGCCWYAVRRYWDVYARPVADPNEWSADRQVFSR